MLPSPRGPRRPRSDGRLLAVTLTLVVDCGGSGIKASVLDAEGTARATAVRVPTPYPLPPGRFLDCLDEVGRMLPRQPGTKESRYTHLLAGDVIHAESEQARVESAVISSARGQGDRVADLERQVAALSEEIGEIRQQLAAFRRQFE